MLGLDKVKEEENEFIFGDCDLRRLKQAKRNLRLRVKLRQKWMSPKPSANHAVQIYQRTTAKVVVFARNAQSGTVTLAI
jgi:hypothetical protein